MKIINLLRQNYNLSSDIQDIHSRTLGEYNPPEDISTFLETSDWIASKENEFVEKLSEKINELLNGQHTQLLISHDNVLEMKNIVDNYYKSQKGLKLSFNEFFSDHPQLIERYNSAMTEEEGLYNYNGEFETLYMKIELPSEKGVYIVRAMVELNQPKELNKIGAGKGFEEQEKIRSQLIESGAFPFSVDISEKCNGLLTPLLTVNDVNFLTVGKNNSVLESITQIVQNDNKVMESFCNRNAAFNDFNEQRTFINHILKDCQTDSIFAGVSLESLKSFNNVIEMNKEENILKSSATMQEVLSRISGMRNSPVENIIPKKKV